MAKREYFKRQQVIWFFIIASIMVAVFIVLLTLQSNEMNDLQDDVRQLRRELSVAEQELIFYRGAYEKTLQDIESLTKIYGGQRKYEQNAATLKREEIVQLLGEIETKTLPPGTWSRYTANTSCVPVVQITQPDVLVAFRAYGSGTVAVLVDNVELGSWEVVNERVAGLNVILQGKHEITLFSETGNITLSDVFVGPYSIRTTTIDAGVDFFDCVEAPRGKDLLEPATLRLVVELPTLAEMTDLELEPNPLVFTVE